jgi:hypothetical protein
VSRFVVRLVAAVVLTAATGLGVPSPAHAASCSTGHGVTVVVDFHQLGGGARSACDRAGAGRPASTQLTDVGHRLTYAQQQPGFVCRVDGSPSSDPCLTTSPADAYWSLWWSDGKSGTWSFSSEGVGSLTVPDGGYVALSWQGSTRKAPPRVAPRSHPTPSPSPTSSPTTAPSSPASPPATPPQSSLSATPSPTHLGHSGQGSHHRPGRPGHRPHHGHQGHQGHQAHQGSSPAPATTDHADAGGPPGQVEPTGSRQPGWLAPGLVALLFGAAAGVYVVRRRRPGGPGA